MHCRPGVRSDQMPRRWPYTLMEALRRLALHGTELAEATCDTIRLKLIKIGTVVVRKLTTVRLHFSSHHPLQSLIRLVVRRLCPT